MGECPGVQLVDLVYLLRVRNALEQMRMPVHLTGFTKGLSTEQDVQSVVD